MKNYFGILFLFVFVLFSLLPINSNAQSSCVLLQNNLKQRDQNNEVKSLQSFLKQKGYLNTEPTGFFGSLTTKAVIDFQKANNINPAVGYVGSITRAKIQSLACDGSITVIPAPTTPAPTPSTQSKSCIDLKSNFKLAARDSNTNAEVSVLQKYLADNKYLDSQATGYFGNQTEKAVIDFQKANNINPAAGYIGPSTRSKIKSLTCTGTEPKEVLVSTGHNQMSKTILSLFSTKAVQFDAILKTTAYDNYNYNSSFNLNKIAEQPPVTTVNISASQDILTPGNIKGKHKISISDTSLLGAGGFGGFSIENLIIGDTVYLKLPNKILSFFTEDSIDNSLGDFWIKIDPVSLSKLPSEFNFAKNLYNYLISFNSQPVQFLKNNQENILKYTQLINSTKYSTKIVDGSPVDVYQFTLNKASLKNLLIAESKKLYYDGKVPAYELEEIDKSLERFKIIDGYFSVFTNTNKPYRLNATFQSFDDYTKKLETSTAIDLTFSNYEKPLIVTPPNIFTTISDFFDKYFKSRYSNLPSGCNSSQGYSATTGERCDGSYNITTVPKNINAVAKNGDTVSINYTARVQNGDVFDSNTQYEFGHFEPFIFQLGVGQVIQGLDEGVVGMKVGEKKTLVIPSNKGYGETQVGPLPPNSTLVFDIEILDINPS